MMGHSQLRRDALGGAIIVGLSNGLAPRCNTAMNCNGSGWQTVITESPKIDGRAADVIEIVSSYLSGP
jgi:hypothetical protein